MHLLNEKLYIDSDFTELPDGPVDNKSALVQVMAWCRIDAKP